MEGKKRLFVLGFGALALALRLLILKQVSAPLFVRHIDLYMSRSYECAVTPELLLTHEPFRAPALASHPYYVMFQTGVYFFNELLNDAIVISMERFQFVVQLAFAVLADVTFLYVCSKAEGTRRYIMMLLYWTNPFIVCDMCFPHPQTFALALFVITVALVMAHCRSLGPIVGALTVVIDPNLAVCVAAVSYFLPAKKNRAFLISTLIFAFVCWHLHTVLLSLKDWTTPHRFLIRVISELLGSMFVNTPFPLFTRPTGFILATYAATAVAGIPLWSKLRKSVPSVTIVAIVLALNVVLAAVLVGSGAHDVRRNFSLKALLDHPVPQQMLFVGMFHRCGRLEHQAELFNSQILMVPSHCSSVGSLPSDEDFAIKALVHVVARPGVIDSLHYIVVSDKIMGEEYKPLRNLLAQQFDLKWEKTVTDYTQEGELMQQRLFVYQRSKNAKPLVPMMELIRDVVV